MNALKIPIFVRMGHVRICWGLIDVSAIMATRSIPQERFVMISMNVKVIVRSVAEDSARILLGAFRWDSDWKSHKASKTEQNSKILESLNLYVYVPVHLSNGYAVWLTNSSLSRHWRMSRSESRHLHKRSLHKYHRFIPMWMWWRIHSRYLWPHLHWWGSLLWNLSAFLKAQSYVSVVKLCF